MFNFSKPIIALLLATAFLAACTSPAGHQDSRIVTPDSWYSTNGEASATPLATSSQAEVDQIWWTHFDDPTLNALVAEALADNKTLRIAMTRVEAARADRGVAKANLLPQISATGTASRGNQGYATNDQSISLASADIEASWELDLFGRNQARLAEANAILQAADANRQAVMVGLLAELARNYFDLRNDEQQISLTEQNLETERKTLGVIKAQLEGALASDFDVQRASAQVSTTESLIPALQAAADAARNRINVLLGVLPGTRNELLSTSAPLKPLDHHILIAAPAAVLATRPDVRAAERQFAASISAKDVATAALFPDISLTALFGRQAATPFSTTPWGIGLNLVQPILNFGLIESQIDRADADQRQAFLTYQQTILEATENMENALSSYLHETGRNVSLTASVKQTSRAAELAQRQFTEGYTGLLDVLVAQRDTLNAEAAQTASDFALRIDLVNIYAAAGGGWKD